MTYDSQTVTNDSQLDIIDIPPDVNDTLPVTYDSQIVTNDSQLDAIDSLTDAIDVFPAYFEPFYPLAEASLLVF